MGSCWHHIHTSVPDNSVPRQSNTHKQCRRLGHHVHLAHADCSIVTDPTPQIQSHTNSVSLNHHAHAHRATIPPQTQTNKTTDAKTTMTQCWQLNVALRKKIINCLFLPSSLNPTIHRQTPSYFQEILPKVSRLGLTSIFFCFVLDQPWWWDQAVLVWPCSSHWYWSFS